MSDLAMIIIIPRDKLGQDWLHRCRQGGREEGYAWHQRLSPRLTYSHVCVVVRVCVVLHLSLSVDVDVRHVLEVFLFSVSQRW